MNPSAALDWAAIDTVLLDMDGTLLDLRFDNWFWREHIPLHYGSARGITAALARDTLVPRFHAVKGTLQWYCVDYWSRELDLDILAIKRAACAHIGYLPGAKQFLARLEATGKRRVLVTNAHPATLQVKNEKVGLTAHFDAWYSTHQFHAPKESDVFWPRFQACESFDPGRTLFVDDSVPVLDAARAFGVGWLRAIRHPDSSLPGSDIEGYDAVDSVADLL